MSTHNNIEVNEDNNEISINYVMTWKNVTILVDNIFAYNVTHDIIYKSEYEKCRHRNDWLM